MKILTFSSLYPSAHRPRFGVFVQTRLLKLLEIDGVQAIVVAPVPWFPFRSGVFKRWAEFARVERVEVLAGVQVFHPRYIVIPKIGMLLTPFFLAISGLYCIWRLKRQNIEFDIIDAHYFYPDGIAAAIIGYFVGKPVVVTARGSDINMISDYHLPRLLIQWAMRRSALNFGVSDAICEKMVKLGCDPKKVLTARNGVDLELFREVSNRKVSHEYYLPDKFIILSIGNLVALKGHDLVIKAISKLPNTSLLIVGRGSEKLALQQLVTEYELESRVQIIDEFPQFELPTLYSDANLLVLASSSEGMPNVILEALACGTPVVATEVGGIPEVVAEPLVGYLVDRNVEAIRDAIEKVQYDPPQREVVRAHAEQFSWAQTIGILHGALENVLARSAK